MPVYDISGTVISPLAAVDILVDEGTAPATVLGTATSEMVYNALQNFFTTIPNIPRDGSYNIIETTSDWHALMHWATQPWTPEDDFNITPFLDYVMQLFQEYANTSSIPPPYWKNVQGTVFTLVQQSCLTYMIYILRSVYKSAGLPQPTQV